jgi:hypothetical protein
VKAILTRELDSGFLELLLKLFAKEFTQHQGLVLSAEGLEVLIAASALLVGQDRIFFTAKSTLQDA